MKEFSESKVPDRPSRQERLASLSELDQETVSLLELHGQDSGFIQDAIDHFVTLRYPSDGRVTFWEDSYKEIAQYAIESGDRVLAEHAVAQFHDLRGDDAWRAFAAASRNSHDALTDSVTHKLSEARIRPLSRIKAAQIELARFSEEITNSQPTKADRASRSSSFKEIVALMREEQSNPYFHSCIEEVFLDVLHDLVAHRGKKQAEQLIDSLSPDGKTEASKAYFLYRALHGRLYKAELSLCKKAINEKSTSLPLAGAALALIDEERFSAHIIKADAKIRAGGIFLEQMPLEVLRRHCPQRYVQWITNVDLTYEETIGNREIAQIPKNMDALVRAGYITRAQELYEQLEALVHDETFGAGPPIIAAQLRTSLRMARHELWDNEVVQNDP